MTTAQNWTQHYQHLGGTGAFQVGASPLDYIFYTAGFNLYVFIKPTEKQISDSASLMSLFKWANSISANGNISTNKILKEYFLDKHHLFKCYKQVNSRMEETTNRLSYIYKYPSQYHKEVQDEDDSDDEWIPLSSSSSVGDSKGEDTAGTAKVTVGEDDKKKSKRKLKQKKQKKELSMDEIKQVVNKWFRIWGEIETRTHKPRFDGLDFVLTTLDFTPTVSDKGPMPLPDHMIRKYMALRDLCLWVNPLKDTDYTDTHVRNCFNRVSSYIYDAIKNMTHIHVYHPRYSSDIRDHSLNYSFGDDTAWGPPEEEEKGELDEKEMKELDAALIAAATTDAVEGPRKKKQKTYDDKKVQELLAAVSKAREKVDKCEEREAELKISTDALTLEKEQAVVALDFALEDLNDHLRYGSK